MPSKKKSTARRKTATKATSRKSSTASKKNATVPRTMTPEQAMNQVRIAGRRILHLEKIISQCPEAALEYAESVIKGRWIEGEKAIQKDGGAAYSYVWNILKRRWPEAEPAILTDPQNAVWYADYFIGQPWPELESVLRSSSDASKAAKWLYDYARLVLKGALPADLDKKMHLWAFQKPTVEEAARYINDKTKFATMPRPERRFRFVNHKI